MASTPRELAFDSNLLLLFTVGSFEPRVLKTFKRLSMFTHRDLVAVQAVAMNRRLIATPHILTEVSNLANSLPEVLRKGFLTYLAANIHKFSERFSSTQELCNDHSFTLFGLTDAAICSLATEVIVVTEDARLRAYMHRRGLFVLSLEDIRISDRKAFGTTASTRDRQQS
jgi:hypothetical protein